MALKRPEKAVEPRSLQKAIVTPLSEKERSERFNALFEMGCAICGQPPQIHHLIGTKWRGMGQKAHDMYTIPLCLNHHTGQQGIHKVGMRQWEFQYGTQEELLEITNLKLQMLKDIHKNGYVDVDAYCQNDDIDQ